MQSWGTWGKSQALYYIKKGKKNREDTEGASDPPRLFSHVPKVLLLLSNSLHHWHHEGTSGCLRHACTLHPSLQTDRAVWLTSRLKRQETDPNVNKHDTPREEPWISLWAGWVHGSVRIPHFSSFCPDAHPASTVPHCKPGLILPARPGLLSNRRLLRANPSPAKPPHAPLQCCPKLHPSFQHLDTFILFYLTLPKKISSQSGRTKLIFLLNLLFSAGLS